MPKVIQRRQREPGVEKPSDLWRTDPALFAALHEEFAFDLDCAANRDNHLVDRWLGPGGVAEDALVAPGLRYWGNFGTRGYLNPPYSTDLILPFLRQTVIESQWMTLVLLVPYTPDTRWWAFTDYAVEIREIPHRVKYVQSDGRTAAAAMFPSAVLVYRPQPGVLRGDPRRVVWDYPDSARRVRGEILDPSIARLGHRRRLLLPT